MTLQTSTQKQTKMRTYKQRRIPYLYDESLNDIECQNKENE